MMRVFLIIFIIIIIKIARQLIVIRKIKLHKGKHSNYTNRVLAAVPRLQNKGVNAAVIPGCKFLTSGKTHLPAIAGIGSILPRRGRGIFF